MKTRIAYYLLYSIWYLFSLLPMWLHYRLSDLLYLLLYYVAHYRRKTVESNLATSFPEMSDGERKRIEKKFYAWLCDYFVECVKLMSIRRENIMRRMRFENIELINEVLRSGQDVNIYLGHYCNWEWATTISLHTDGILGAVYHPLENAAFDRLFLHLRERFGKSVGVPMNSILRYVARYRKEKQPILWGLLSDQKPHWVNIHYWTNFLNHDTPVLTGTERIAKATGNAVVFLELRRERRGYYVGTIKCITRHPKDFPDYELTQKYFELFEENIRRAPECWLWSHKRWARTHEEFDRRFYYDKKGRVIERKPGDAAEAKSETL